MLYYNGKWHEWSLQQHRLRPSTCTQRRQFFKENTKIEWTQKKRDNFHRIFVFCAMRISFMPAACFLSESIFLPFASVCFTCMYQRMKWSSARKCVCACGIFTITTYYNDCVCACTEMFWNLQFTRSTNGIEFYGSHQSVIMIICTKNTVPHVHKDIQKNASSLFYVSLSIYRSHSFSPFSVAHSIHFIHSFTFSAPVALLANSLGFTLECQTYKQYLCMN